MNRIPLVLAIALAGCATHTLSTEGPRIVEVPEPDVLADGTVSLDEHYATQARVTESLDALEALELVHFGALVVDAPDASHNCYGPCADDPVDQAWMAEHARQAERLVALVDLAEQIAAAPAEPSADANAAVDALDALEIVEVTGVHFVSDGSCYISVCPGDDVKRGRVEQLAEAANGL